MNKTDELKVFLDGTFVPSSIAKISVYNHGILYGDGIFEGIRAYNGRIFKLIEHIDRLYDSAKMINLTIQYTKKEIIDFVRATLRINQLNEAYIRLVITRGNGDLGLDPKSCTVPTIFIITKPMAPIADPKGISAITYPMRRIPHSVFSPNIKSLNYLNNILAKQFAGTFGCQEAIFLDMEGNVSEGSAENIFMVKDNTLITPPYIGSLRGITRDTILDIASELKGVFGKLFDIEIKNISIFELYAADEVFMTGTAAELAPVVKIDGRTIGDGKPGCFTVLLQSKFKELTNKVGVPI